jgi:hypothetical protein
MSSGPCTTMYKNEYYSVLGRLANNHVSCSWVLMANRTQSRNRKAKPSSGRKPYPGIPPIYSSKQASTQNTKVGNTIKNNASSSHPLSSVYPSPPRPQPLPNNPSPTNNHKNVPNTESPPKQEKRERMEPTNPTRTKRTSRYPQRPEGKLKKERQNQDRPSNRQKNHKRKRIRKKKKASPRSDKQGR